MASKYWASNSMRGMVQWYLLWRACISLLCAWLAQPLAWYTLTLSKAESCFRKCLRASLTAHPVPGSCGALGVLRVQAMTSTWSQFCSGYERFFSIVAPMPPVLGAVADGVQNVEFGLWANLSVLGPLDRESQIKGSVSRDSEHDWGMPSNALVRSNAGTKMRP